MIRKVLRKMMWKLPKSYILVFHHVEDQPRIEKSSCKLTTESFYEIIDSIDCCVRLSELLDKKMRNKVALTFDDGLRDVYTIVYPYLTERNIPFTIFVVYDFLDMPGYITTEQLIEMANNELVTVGVHGMTHKVLTHISIKEKESEIKISKEKLERLLGRSLDYFAYSHGQYDNDTTRLVNKTGYKNAVTVSNRPFNIYTSRRRFEIPRINIDNRNIDSFILLRPE